VSATQGARPRAETDAILALDDVCKRFDHTDAADHLSLTIDRGAFFTFLGPSGSGKSTVLRMVAGLETPDSGRVLIEGRDVSGVPPWRRNLGMVFQQYAVFPHMTVAENVGYGLRVRKVPAAAVTARVGELLALVGLAGMETKNVTLMSGGEQQRVALARALALEPKPGLWPWSRRCCCSTSRWRRSTRRSAATCRPSSSTSSARPAPPSSMSPTTRRKP